LPGKSIKEEAAVKKLMKKIDDILVAITFAEAGEYETASETLEERYAEPLMGSEAAEAAYESA
jgi:hypothetical protein